MIEGTIKTRTSEQGERKSETLTGLRISVIIESDWRTWILKEFFTSVHIIDHILFNDLSWILYWYSLNTNGTLRPSFIINLSKIWNQTLNQSFKIQRHYRRTNAHITPKLLKLCSELSTNIRTVTRDGSVSRIL